MIHVLCMRSIRRDQGEALRQALKTRPEIERVFIDHTRHGYFVLCSIDWLQNIAAWILSLEGVYAVSVHELIEL